MKDKLVRLMPIFLIIAIAILLIAVIVNIYSSLFKGESRKPEVVDTSSEQLLSNGVNRSVKMTVRGPIVARENSRSYTVEITPSSRSLKTYKGYIQEVIQEIDLGNDVKAYDQFVFALNKARMMVGKELSGEADDLRGVCASGHVYDFAILEGGEVKKHLWTSTCSGSPGSLKGNAAQLQNLFILQIPDSNKVVKDLGVSSLK